MRSFSSRSRVRPSRDRRSGGASQTRSRLAATRLSFCSLRQPPCRRRPFSSGVAYQASPASLLLTGAHVPVPNRLRASLPSRPVGGARHATAKLRRRTSRSNEQPVSGVPPGSAGSKTHPWRAKPDLTLPLSVWSGHAVSVWPTLDCLVCDSRGARAESTSFCTARRPHEPTGAHGWLRTPPPPGRAWAPRSVAPSSRNAIAARQGRSPLFGLLCCAALLASVGRDPSKSEPTSPSSLSSNPNCGYRPHSCRPYFLTAISRHAPPRARQAFGSGRRLPRHRAPRLCRAPSGPNRGRVRQALPAVQRRQPLRVRVPRLHSHVRRSGTRDPAGSCRAGYSGGIEHRRPQPDSLQLYCFHDRRAVCAFPHDCEPCQPSRLPANLFSICSAPRICIYGIEDGEGNQLENFLFDGDVGCSGTASQVCPAKRALSPLEKLVRARQYSPKRRAA